MTGVFGFLQGLFGFVSKPIEKIIDGRNQKQAAKDELEMARHSTAQMVTISKETLKLIRVKGLDTSWKDEFATVVWLQIPVLIVWGTIMEGFGFPQITQGVIDSVHYLNEIMKSGPVGEIMLGVTAAAIGITVFKK